MSLIRCRYSQVYSDLKGSYMSQDIDVEILAETKSEWKLFTIIKNRPNANLDKTLRAKFFNSTVLPRMLYSSDMWFTTKIEENRPWGGLYLSLLEPCLTLLVIGPLSAMWA